MITLKLLPPQEAIDYFRAKGYKVGFDYRDVWQQEHQSAFTVAKAMELDLLVDIRAAVDAALANGTTLKQFRDELRPNLIKRGWWGRQDVVDPKTGQTVSAQLGSPRRLKVIFDTNLSTAYAEGRWQRIQAAKGALPYLLYDHTPSAHERPEHAAWDGLVLPVDDPWWQLHYPVKAWGCKCRVIQLGDRQLQRLGKTRPDRAPGETWFDYTNERTGQTQSIPAGVDPAFHYPPAARKPAIDRMLADKQARAAELLAPPAAAPAIAAPVTLDDYLAAGRSIAQSLPSAAANPRGFHAALLARLEAEVGISTPCAVASRGEAADLVKAASRLFPNTWTAAADQAGPLYTRLKRGARAFHISTEARDAGARIRIPGFGPVTVPDGAGYILLGSPDAIDVAVHEFAHRLQHVLPALDAWYQQLHDRRTEGAAIKRLRDLTGNPGYHADEVTREDSYITPYQGKIYRHKGDRALEVITIAMQAVLGAAVPRKSGFSPVEMLRTLYTKDREMVELTLGLLFHWSPGRK